MLFGKVLFCFFVLHLVNSQLQINLYLTDWVSEDENLQHDCLRVPVHTENESDPYQVISYCMSELSSKFKIEENSIDQKFTFDELSKQNITSQQLYNWSAPIDLIENYQFYLNQLENFENTNMTKEIFYNCTFPYFGPKCQYKLHYHRLEHSSLDEIIYDYYYYNRYEPTLFTCYIHLECNRGPFPSCLDWSEICDGKVDCLDGGYDEEHCWELEIHQCNENEYQCSNGQCIPEALFKDGSTIYDCLDKSDIDISLIVTDSHDSESIPTEPTFKYEDVICVKFYSRWDISNNFDFSYTLVSSCIGERQNLLFQAIFSIKPNVLSNECWTAMKCLMQMPIPFGEVCKQLCFNKICDKIVQNTCPDTILVPAVPFLFGHIYLAYQKNQTRIIPFRPTWPHYACYNNQLLHLPIDQETLSLFTNTECRYPPDATYTSIQRGQNWIYYAEVTRTSLEKYQALFYSDPRICNRSNTYECFNSSKCISKSRVFDGVNDCFYEDDEGMVIDGDNELISPLIRNCSIEQSSNYFKCINTNECIHRSYIRDQKCDCTEFDGYHCDDEHFDFSYARHTISFQTICDNFPHLSPKSIEGQEETDETNCEQWPFIHIYNQCDGFWHMLNGSDEINCYSKPLLNCSANNHICVSRETNEMICLPIEKANDGIIDCLGAADEPTICRNYLDKVNSETFYCNQAGSECVEGTEICDTSQNCANNEDEQPCGNDDFPNIFPRYGICVTNYEMYASDVVKILCRHFLYPGPRLRVYFTLDQRQNLVEQNIEHANSLMVLPHQFNEKSIESYQQRCHRGLDLQVWLDKEKNITTSVCFCPPSYYGEICQYQNQRISLTLQFRVATDSIKIPFLIIISLIDDTDERIIHSYEQFTYLPMKNCQRRYNFYLLYSTRPKDEMKQYSIHIDIYEKITLKYRGSIIKSLNFSFLPVHRLVYQLDIPHILDDIDNCSDDQCINGKCFKYFNDPNNRTFCQCNKGWSGRYCTIQYTSICSSDSLCLGKLANNRSLCVCSLNKMGPRCLIDDNICKNNKTVTCYNEGQCVPLNEYEISKVKFICICTKNFTGDKCDIARLKLIVSFDKNIILTSPIFIHFIEVKVNAVPVRTTTLKSIYPEQDSIIVYWPLPFHIAFVELSNKTYYLIYMKKIYKQSAVIEKKLNSSDRCLHISELFDKTIANSSLLRRIKYYHLPCQNDSLHLSCFYDEIHLCLCQPFEQQHLANCFEFDHNKKMNCSSRSGCLNDGHCLQENTECPRLSICVCPVCYYGPQCQFDTNLYSLSVDTIIGFHIRPNLKISHQPSAIKISITISSLIIVLGITNGILSLITFKNKSTREFGCGLYLLTSSIITLLTMIVFPLKFFIVLFSQIGSIQNHLFLTIHCYSIDFLLRFCLTMDQWLTAFVAIERAYITIKGINFNTKKTKLRAKWTISSLVMVTILTNIHDPIHRSLFEENNDDDEKRISCNVKYPPTIETINSVVNIFHFIVPFIINVTSAIIIITISTRQRKAIQKKQKYNEILKEQIQQHKNLLIGPCVLIILGIPRLIISFVPGCMKSSSDSWLFLFGYFISLVPPLLTFILFVLPSTIYTQAFKKAMSEYRNMIRRRS